MLSDFFSFIIVSPFYCHFCELNEGIRLRRENQTEKWNKISVQNENASGTIFSFSFFFLLISLFLFLLCFTGGRFENELR